MRSLHEWHDILGYIKSTNNYNLSIAFESLHCDVSADMNLLKKPVKRTKNRPYDFFKSWIH
jgi:hypothetical protein